MSFCFSFFRSGNVAQQKYEVWSEKKNCLKFQQRTHQVVQELRWSQVLRANPSRRPVLAIPGGPRLPTFPEDPTVLADRKARGCRGIQEHRLAHPLLRGRTVQQAQKVLLVEDMKQIEQDPEKFVSLSASRFRFLPSKSSSPQRRRLHFSDALCVCVCVCVARTARMAVVILQLSSV